jgi:hypothetical protein
VTVCLLGINAWGYYSGKMRKSKGKQQDMPPP